MEFLIVLNEYEVSNLRAALEAILSSPSPLTALNTGDWVGQIYHKLPSVDSPPNATAATMAETARLYGRIIG